MATEGACRDWRSLIVSIFQDQASGGSPMKALDIGRVASENVPPQQDSTPVPMAGQLIRIRDIENAQFWIQDRDPARLVGPECWTVESISRNLATAPGAVAVVVPPAVLDVHFHVDVHPALPPVVETGHGAVECSIEVRQGALVFLAVTEDPESAPACILANGWWRCRVSASSAVGDSFSIQLWPEASERPVEVLTPMDLG